MVRRVKPLMKLELIAPATQDSLRKRIKPPGPPLGLAMIAALTPPDVEVSITDENTSDIDFEKDLDLVGITTMTITAPRAYQIADVFRAKGVKVILGGSHPSALAKEAGQHADAVLIGEAEEIWPKVIEDCRNSNPEHLADPPFHAKMELPALPLFPSRFNTSGSTVFEDVREQRCTHSREASSGQPQTSFT